MKGIAIFIISIILLGLTTALVEIKNNDDEENVINIRTIPDSVFSTFLSLLDTPNSYSSADELCLKVNETLGQVYFGSCSNVSINGDITSVLGDVYITNGSTSGAVQLIFNETKLNQTIGHFGNLVGFNSTFNSTYATFAYNQTIGAINDINSRFWNRTQLYNITSFVKYPSNPCSVTIWLNPCCNTHHLC